MALTETININSAVLVWARESLALSKNQACDRTGISAKRLVQLESGEKLPTVEELKSLAKSYKRTIATLLLQQVPKEKPLPKDQRTTNSDSIGKFHEKSIMAVRKARALVQSYMELRQDLDLAFPILDLNASITDRPEDVAAIVSKRLDLKEIRSITNINLALEGYIEKIESLGVVVFQLGLTQDGLRGISITDDFVPIIGIKRGGEKPHSKTFTLFHELGHILLNEGGLCDISLSSNILIEKWCNAFAAEILVPTPDLLQHPIVVEHDRLNDKTWKLKELVELGCDFHVGPLAILRRLLDNDRTTHSFYLAHHEKWNKPTFGISKEHKGREVHKESFKERGRTFVYLAFKAYDQNRIDIKDLSDFLGLRFSYIPKIRSLLTA